MVAGIKQGQPKVQETPLAEKLWAVEFMMENSVLADDENKIAVV